jgi:hypothetical protein
MSYHSDLSDELRHENADLRAKLERYGGWDSSDIYEHKGVQYFSLNQVEIPAEVLVSVLDGLNTTAERKVIQAVKAALTTEQRLFIDKMDEATIEQPAGAAVLYRVEKLIAENDGVLSAMKEV